MRISSSAARCVIALALGMPSAGAAQTDYYNTDAGRPVRIEDAYAIERRAFELQVAPIRIERGRGGQYRWGIEPELAYGVLPRTQLEIGLPMMWIDTRIASPGAGSRRGLAGIDISVLHNLNAETSIPAVAVGAELLLPVGSLAPSQAFPTIKGIATKTFPWARFHVNAQYTLGNEESGDAIAGVPAPLGAGAAEASRWLAGIAVDRTFALRSLLITGEVFAQGAMDDDAEGAWNASVGTRYQLSPRWAIDAGVGRRLSGSDLAWSFTAGGALAFGLPWNR